MTTISIRHFVAKQRGDGTMRYYWQPTKALIDAGFKTERLPDTKSDALHRAEELNRAVDEWRKDPALQPNTDKAGSVDAMIRAYKKSRFYKELKPSTEKEYRRYLKFISAWAGGEQARSITPKMVSTLYEEQLAKYPRAAGMLIAVLRRLFWFGERANFISPNANPARNPGIRNKPKKTEIWSEEAVIHFVATADKLGLFAVGTAVMVNEWLGQRPGDVIALQMNQYQDGVLQLIQSKTGAEAFLPIDEAPQVQKRLEQQIAINQARGDKCAALLQHSRFAEGYSPSGFMKAFTTVRDEAAKTMPEIAELQFKALRHTAITRLGEAGCTPQEIAAISGHSLKTCVHILNTYNVATKKMARSAFRRRQTSTTNQGESNEKI